MGESLGHGPRGGQAVRNVSRLDVVAYVRFASVYLDFKDVQEFLAELKDLLRTKEVTEPQSKAPTKTM